MRKQGTIRNQDISSPTTNFKVDDRSFSELLHYIVSYLSHINYYNLENKIEGNWQDLVKDDPIIFMAYIINYSTHDLDEVLKKVHVSYDEECYTIDMMLGKIDEIQDWYVSLTNLGEHKLAEKIYSIVFDILDTHKQRLFEIRKEISLKKNSGQAHIPGKEVISHTAPSNRKDSFNEIIFHLKKIIDFLQELTAEYLESYDNINNDHMPNNAMYIAFALVYKNIRDNINTLSQRHLDFYYKDILEQKLSTGSPVKTIVSFELLPNIASSIVEKGTSLSAGKLFGSKNDVLFQTDAPLVVSSIKVSDIQTLYLNKQSFIKVGTDDAVVSYIIKNNILENGKKIDKKKSFPVFGGNLDDLIDSSVKENAVLDFGFIISSPVLFLNEGKRTISIEFKLEANSAKAVFYTYLNQIVKNNLVSLKTAAQEILGNAFIISYTSKKNWQKIAGYEVDFNKEADTFTINIVLDNADPSLELYPKAEYESSWPSLKFELNIYAPAYAYSFFKGVNIEKIKIKTRVIGVKNLSLYNNIGKMPLAKSFDLFGPFPQPGNYLMLGKSEFYKKKITRLNINLYWKSLPKDYGGFNTYYQDYSTQITNDSFKVKFSVLSDGYWLPLNPEDSRELNLFQTEACISPEGYHSVQLKDKTILDYTSNECFRDFRLTDPLKYNVETQSGFIKITLVRPECGFGNEVYLNDMRDIAIYNAKHKKQIDIPVKPYTPAVNSISVDYEAEDILDFSGASLNSSSKFENISEYTYITPFGLEKGISDQKVWNQLMFPQYSADGYLFLGFENVKESTVISMYFDFVYLHNSQFGNSDQDINTQEQLLCWQYLEDNEWLDFERDNIIKDGTSGFVKSGIVEIILPFNKKMLDGDLKYWVRIFSKTESWYYPSVKSISLNAVNVTCVSEDPNVMGKKLSAGSIKSVVGKLADIKKVTQPSDTIGGVENESEDLFYSNISERLRNKDRAISIRDYESLILKEFKDVIIVKCFNLNESCERIAGAITIVVLNSAWKVNDYHNFNQDELYLMESYLKNLSGAFVNINVINPKLEYLIVKGALEFVAEDTSGYYMNKLNEDINNFISPLNEFDNDIGGIGGGVTPSTVENYVRNLSYIQVVHELLIEQIINDGINNYSMGVFQGSKCINSTTPFSMLTPYSSHEFLIQKSKSKYNLSGIDNLSIGKDFILAEKTTEIENEPNVEPKEKKPDSILVFKNIL